MADSKPARFPETTTAAINPTAKVGRQTMYEVSDLLDQEDQDLASRLAIFHFQNREFPQHTARGISTT
jgi:hypothetical protein